MQRIKSETRHEKKEDRGKEQRKNATDWEKEENQNGPKKNRKNEKAKEKHLKDCK